MSGEAPRAPRGTYDILPEESISWQYLEGVFRKTAEDYGYGGISTPIFEEEALFSRGVGSSTDIVRKEMYRFIDLGGRELALRPEGTAGVARAFIEHKLWGGRLPFRVHYLGPMFRYERPQGGRYRQHFQAGVEAFGSASPETDAEVISLLMDFYARVGLGECRLLLNTMGHPECRVEYRAELTAFLTGQESELCEDCRERARLNPLRTFDCKSESCRAALAGAPRLAESVCDDCAGHLAAVRAHLDGIGIAYEMEDSLVRGFDYYTRTTFEVQSAALGAQNAVGGGGRYDGLVEALGGPATPGVGFGLGFERLILALREGGVELPGMPAPAIYLAALGPQAKAMGFALAVELRRRGIAVETDPLERGLKAQMKAADKLGAALTVIIGEAELAEGRAVLRDMKSGEQGEAPLDGLAETLAKKST